MTYNNVASGLRGGAFTYAATDEGYDFDLKGVRFTQDVAVSGTVSWDQTSNIITAQVTLNNSGQAVGALTIARNDANINAIAAVSGTIQGALLNAERIAP